MKTPFKTLYQEIQKGFFLGSLLTGICIWVFFFLTTPINVKNLLTTEAILFIVFNYLALIIGYYFSKEKVFNPIQLDKDKKRMKGFLRFIIILVFASAILRYIDLFFIRNVSFFNEIELNKYNISKEENFSLGIGLLSMFRLLYFVPFVLYHISNERKRLLLSITVFFFLIPIMEGFLRGSRRLILEPVLIMCITLIIVKVKNIKIDWKKIGFGLLTLLLLFMSSQYILKERVKNVSDNYKQTIVSAQYNELVPLKEKTKEYIVNNRNSKLSSLVLFYCHLGQYITHGVFEFDYMKSINSKPRFGLYNSLVIVKLFNKAGLTNYPLDELNNPSNRITYITFFGGLYLDFKWFSLLIMFLFGFLQRKTYSLSKKYYVLKPILVLFAMVNVMMLIFNFFRAQVLVTILVYILALIIFKLVQKKRIIEI